MNTVAKRMCTFKGCDRTLLAKGFCQAHYQRYKKGADMGAPLRKTQRATRSSCAVMDCDIEATSAQLGSYCDAHRKRSLRGVSLGSAIAARNRFDTCLMTGCDLPHASIGGCGLHSRRASKYGLTIIQLDAMLLKGFCESCGKRDDREMHIDHDHACCPGARSCGNCVRGLLCPACNAVLAYSNDSIDTLQKAIAYLSR